ncbi:MAG TPA: ATP-binding protein [Vicinamibacterales bacterium]|nr:ATP-binding protein [Vicinamibacterales bacterium]
MTFEQTPRDEADDEAGGVARQRPIRLHPLLTIQLKQVFGSAEAVPREWSPLVDLVNQTYKQAEVDRRQAERDLQAAHLDMETRVEERTRALETANESLRQAQKMEAIGALAGGIAHDFNNLLTVIGGCTEMLLSDRTLRDPDRLELEEIRRATKRATALTQQLLAFGRKQVMAPRTIDLNSSVLQMLQMLSRVLPDNISLVPDPAAHPAWVRLDPSQIEQVLLNLVLNARDAMPNGGQIRIAVDHQHQSVCLSVCDTGAGMPPEVLARVFEPFFTTKGSHGSGLGLASAHGIVHQSNGEITVDSTEGIGTTVTMRFPAAEQSQGDGAPKADGRPGKKTVLLVEDEEPVRRVLRMMLERGGLRVIEAASPIEACAIFEEDASRVDVLVTDVIMPEMNGPTMAKRFLSLRPDLPVLFISGHSNVSSELLTPDNPRIAFLPKPVGATQLAVRVRELLALITTP